jgi:lycopene beta-cyclase
VGRRCVFFILLNRLLFSAPAAERYLILQKFYGLPAALVARFYHGTPTWTDRVRILSGRPPMSVLTALRTLLGSVPPEVARA